MPIYDALLLQDGVPIPHETHGDLRAMTVADAMRPVAEPHVAEGPVLFPDQSLDHALLDLGRQALTEMHVVKREQRDMAIGLISLRDISLSLDAGDTTT